MLKRREFLQAGIAAIPLVGAVLSTPGFAAEPAAIPLHKVIFDERFPESVTFAREAERLGAQVQAIRGDITKIWYSDLYYRWRESPVAIAGLTTHRSLFCLEMFARDASMRIVHYADHHIGDDGSIQHEVFSKEGTLHASKLNQAGANWTAALAHQIVHFPNNNARPLGKTADALAPQTDPQPLVSWIIAPIYPANGISPRQQNPRRTK